MCLQENELENLESQATILKQELALANKRIDGLQQSLEDDLDYDLDDLGSGDSDVDIGSPHSRRSESASYRSFDDVDEGDNISDRLRRKLDSLEEDIRSRRREPLEDDLYDDSDRPSSRKSHGGDSSSAKRRSTDHDTTKARRKVSEDADTRRRSRRRSDHNDEGYSTKRKTYTDEDTYNLKSS